MPRRKTIAADALLPPEPHTIDDVLAGVTVIDVKPRRSQKKKAAPKLDETTRMNLGEMMGKELRRIDRLAREAKRANRRLLRAKLRYSVLKRLNDSQAEKSLQATA